MSYMKIFEMSPIFLFVWGSKSRRVGQKLKPFEVNTMTPEITYLNEASLTNIADMISKGKISINPDTQILYNSLWMQKSTQCPNREVRM